MLLPWNSGPLSARSPPFFSIMPFLLHLAERCLSASFVMPRRSLPNKRSPPVNPSLPCLGLFRWNFTDFPRVIIARAVKGPIAAIKTGGTGNYMNYLNEDRFGAQLRKSVYSPTGSRDRSFDVPVLNCVNLTSNGQRSIIFFA